MKLLKHIAYFNKLKARYFKGSNLCVVHLSWFTADTIRFYLHWKVRHFSWKGKIYRMQDVLFILNIIKSNSEMLWCQIKKSCCCFLVFTHVDEKIFIRASEYRTICAGFSEQACQPLDLPHDDLADWSIPEPDWDKFCLFPFLSVQIVISLVLSTDSADWLRLC